MVAASGLFLAAALDGEARAGDCGDISVAEMNWASAGVAAHVDKFILHHGYGCSVTMVAGDTVSTFKSMNESARPDLAPEFWANAMRGAMDAAVREGRLVQAAEILADGAVEGWWIPKFVADAHPSMRTVEDALKHPELFPADGNAARGAIHNCPSGWSCQASTANLYRATGAAGKGFDLVEPHSAEALASSIARAFETNTGWLGYYWAPTSIMGRYEMVKLSFGVPHNRADWDMCTAIPNCPTVKVNSYPTSQAFTITTRQFAEKAPEALDYVKTRKWSNAVINGILAWQDENQASNEQAAVHFLRQHEEVWRAWLPLHIAEQVKQHL